MRVLKRYHWLTLNKTFQGVINIYKVIRRI